MTDSCCFNFAIKRSVLTVTYVAILQWLSRYFRDQAEATCGAVGRGSQVQHQRACRVPESNRFRDRQAHRTRGVDCIASRGRVHRSGGFGAGDNQLCNRRRVGQSKQQTVRILTGGCRGIVLFAEALQQAKDLDTEFASTKQLRGPLHGVPISVKVDFFFLFCSVHALITLF